MQSYFSPQQISSYRTLIEEEEENENHTSRYQKDEMIPKSDH
jgi:hypothetical protein